MVSLCTDAWRVPSHAGWRNKLSSVFAWMKSFQWILICLALLKKCEVCKPKSLLNKNKCKELNLKNLYSFLKIEVWKIF